MNFDRLCGGSEPASVAEIIEINGLRLRFARTRAYLAGFEDAKLQIRRRIKPIHGSCAPDVQEEWYRIGVIDGLLERWPT